jgi:hypothetical protein
LRSEGGSIIINKNLIQSIGLKEAVIFCELLSRYNYFEIREELQPDGSFYNTIEDLTYATGIGDRSQRTCIKKLEDLGLIRVQVRGLPSKRYFKITTDYQLILSYIEKGRELIKERRKKTSEEQRYCERGNLETAVVGTNNTNNNTKKNTNKYSPSATPQESVEPPNGVLAQNTSGEPDNTIESEEPITQNTRTTGADQSDLPPKEILSEFLVEEKKEPGERVTPKYIYRLFREKYIKKYRRYPNNPRPSDLPKILGILNSALIKKYGEEKSVQIVNSLFEYYDQLDIDRSKYPRPEITSLSQDWLINKLLDFAYNLMREKEYIKEREEASKKINVPGDYPPIEKFPRTWNSILNDPTVHYGLLVLAQSGYIPLDWFDRFKTEREWAEDFLRKAVLEWNKRNTHQLSLS